MRTMVGLSLALVAFLPAPSLPPLNEKVLEFARSKKGEMVGDGQCTALAREAFQFAAARRFPPFGYDEDFVWGTEVDSLEKALPGDVLQFRDAVFKGRQVLPNGAYKTWVLRYPHHTAIVSAVRKARKGVVLGVLHQNILNKGDDEDKQKTVQEGAISTAELREGWVKAYRPVAR